MTPKQNPSKKHLRLVDGASFYSSVPRPTGSDSIRWDTGECDPGLHHHFDETTG